MDTSVDSPFQDSVRDTKQRERVGLIDISIASSSAQAIRVLEDLLTRQSLGSAKETPVDLQTGSLLLSRSVLTKMVQILKAVNLIVDTIYAELPQTQQAALDEGFFVKEKPAPSKQFSFQSTVNPHAGAQSTVEIPFTHQEPSSSSDTNPTLVLPQATWNQPDEKMDENEEKLPTLYVKHTIRSGQVVRYEGNITIIGDVHAGSEVLAAGDITIWGELRGVAHAGFNGNYRSEIRALKIEAIQLRVADYIARRPDRIYYHRESEGDTSISAELARVADGEIKIFKEVIGR